MDADRSLLYDRLVDQAGGLADSHRWLVRGVPDGARVLDCGCAGGYVARVLAERGCEVDGVECDAAAAERARGACRSVYLGSLDDESFVTSLPGSYDRILFGDVLEHLRDPVATLRWIRPRLRAGGRVLISLPNIAFWRVRLHLLRGRFDYTESGILDRTHLRFYSYDGAPTMARRAGYRVTRRECTYVPMTRLNGGRLGRRLMGLRRNFFAFQTLLEVEACPG